MTYTRQRSNCAPEEANVSAFVDSCVNFTSNVRFYSAEEAAQWGHDGAGADETTPVTALLLGTEAQLLRAVHGTQAHHFPYNAPALEQAIRAADENSVYVAGVTWPAAATHNDRDNNNNNNNNNSSNDDGDRRRRQRSGEAASQRLLIGKVTTVASRHNCPARPDCIYAMIKAAVRQCPRTQPTASLDIYCATDPDYALCIAATVARACNRSFSAKAGRSEHGYVDAGRPVRVVFAAHTEQQQQQQQQRDALAHVARAVQLCQRLVDAPTCLLDTTTFAEIAVRSVAALQQRGHAVTADVLQGEALREQGYGGLYGTGKAAEYPPHLVTLSYTPRPGTASRDAVALVGKGIVYDSGGLAIKPRESMVTMKHDMAGAAAVFCAFCCLVELHAPLTLTSVLCLADNAVGPRSQRNGDLLRLRSGLTIEVNNTDAEGRLVLSDGVYHASAELTYTPRIIVDLATLTGAQAMCTGKLHAAIYANTDASERRFVDAGRRCGDVCFPILYCPELHNAEYKSAIADYRNSVASRVNAPSSCGGAFIGNSLAKGYAGEWVHVDLAAPATHDEATGYGVALLVQAFAADLVEAAP